MTVDNNAMIVVAHRLDIPAAARLAEQLPDARRVVVCPHLADRCQIEGFPVELLQLPGNDVQWSSFSQARKAAQQLQAEIDTHLAVFDPMAPGCDWGQQDLFYAFYTIKGFRALWREAIRRFDSAQWHVLVPDQPWRYGCHSYLPALALLEQVAAASQPLRAYSHALPAWGEAMLPDPAAAGDRRFELLSHVPTCFYDHQHFAQSLLASRRTCLNLRSQHYDVDMGELESTPLVPLSELEARLTPAEHDRIETVLVAITAALRAALTPLIGGPMFLEPQLLAMAGSFRRQMVFALALSSQFDARPPRTLVLSNHEAGLHGPLLSLARRHRCKVLLLPHSKICNAPVPAADLDLHCLNHPVQGMPVQDSLGRWVSSPALAFPEPLTWSAQPPRALQTVGVLLAGVSYNGLCGADLDSYLGGLKAVVDWCADHGLACRIRCKPSEPVVGLLAEGLGWPRERLLADMEGSLAAFAESCSLCLSFDVPTSASIELLRRGVPMLHAQLRPLLPSESALVDPAIVPRALVPELLTRLDLLANDPQQLWAFGRDQFQAYARAWAGARPLTAFL